MGLDALIAQPKNMNIQGLMGAYVCFAVQVATVLDALIVQQVNTNMNKGSESVFIVVQQVWVLDAPIVQAASMNIEVKTIKFILQDELKKACNGDANSQESGGITTKKEVIMNYKKPEVLAQNASQGSFAAGCPAKDMGASSCKQCDRAQ
ncbi:hypothetical protein FACS1894199_03200 [Bacteroidia bacterium]|nr:hypothetical protein FACS1894199_03200 [Bacteroidia bacterium]